jgi:hypothetical protein
LNHVPLVSIDGSPAGCFVTYAKGRGVFEVHTFLLKTCRGGTAIAAGKAAMRYLFSLPDVLKLESLCPACLPESYWFARRCGWKSAGVSESKWLKDGVEHVQQKVEAIKGDALAKAIMPTAQHIEAAEKACLAMPQLDCPINHHFAPGIYCREAVMQPGFYIGHKHRAACLNIVLSGRASVYVDGKVIEIKAPMIFTSPAGARKVALVHEEMRFANIHPTDETDLEKLEEICIEKSAAWIEHQEEIKALQEHAAKGLIE